MSLIWCTCHYSSLSAFCVFCCCHVRENFNNNCINLWEKVWAFASSKILEKRGQWSTHGIPGHQTRTVFDFPFRQKRTCTRWVKAQGARDLAPASSCFMPCTFSRALFIVFQRCDERGGSTAGRHGSSAYNQDASTVTQKKQKLLTVESVHRHGFYCFCQRELRDDNYNCLKCRRATHDRLWAHAARRMNRESGLVWFLAPLPKHTPFAFRWFWLKD